MSQSKKSLPAYRTVVLPGLGRVQVPEHLSDAEVLAQVPGEDTEATPAKKTKKNL